jgi:hypothetical protein
VRRTDRAVLILRTSEQFALAQAVPRISPRTEIAAWRKYAHPVADVMASASLAGYNGIMANPPLIRRAIIILITFLFVAMAGMLALGIALYRG